jgi:hypothetical protein
MVASVGAVNLAMSSGCIHDFTRSINLAVPVEWRSVGFVQHLSMGAPVALPNRRGRCARRGCAQSDDYHRLRLFGVAGVVRLHRSHSV